MTPLAHSRPTQLQPQQILGGGGGSMHPAFAPYSSSMCAVPLLSPTSLVQLMPAVGQPAPVAFAAASALMQPQPPQPPPSQQQQQQQQ